MDSIYDPGRGGIAAIPTEYAGVKFRSKLESQWAVYFDRADIEWQYEPKKFGNYIPDFFLPKYDCYAEVKPRVEGRLLFRKSFDFWRNGRGSIALLEGEPEPGAPISVLRAGKGTPEILNLPGAQEARAQTEFQPIPDERGVTPQLALPPERFVGPLEDWIATPTKPRWLLRDRLEHGVLAVMAGPRGAYKSFIALDWTMNVAKDHGEVYIISAEGMDYDRRASAWINTFAPRWDYRRRVFVVQRRIDLTRKDSIELIRSDCRAWGIRPKLFIFDGLSKLTKTLDTPADVTAFLGVLDNGLKRAFNATVLLTVCEQLGEILGPVTDAFYDVSKCETCVYITRNRFKSSPELGPLCLKPEIVPLGYEDDEGQMVTSLVMREVEAPRQPDSETGPPPAGYLRRRCLRRRASWAAETTLLRRTRWCNERLQSYHVLKENATLAAPLAVGRLRNWLSMDFCIFTMTIRSG